MTVSRYFHAVLFAASLALAICSAPALAQKLGPDGAPNPTASSVQEQQLLNELSRIEGRIDIPDRKAAVLIQPAGRMWDYFHEVLLHWGAAIVILGTLLLLGVAYIALGRLPIKEGRSGLKLARFKAIERFSHWLTATSFVLLGLTGLNITFGKILLLPVVGPEAFTAVSEVSKYIHNFVSFAFVVGLVLIAVIFVKDNFFQRVDIEWVKQGGGFIASKHAPAGRFNLGEKLVFWLSLGAGLAISVSGFLLLFPFSVTDIFGMQIAQVVHSAVAVLFIALILGHIYIGTLGMEGAFEAMGTGEVDLNWAKEHHDRWAEEQIAKGNGPKSPLATPAE
ncbi:formate dehydrogenase subunit gamma [Candidatus Phyllobacterium onerii]|uniref:formate dehydrogenase subunit gamma n=1 Tax=Candidatus Phyllobacterium onerii TaxID=3020828 RepID=UPI00232E55DD|nr:formate dehydrogenase subunit gamma [Phyllobacterium sp. IY22]